MQITLEREKETTNKVRFSEPGEPHEHHLGTLYVPKSTLAKLGNPAQITLTLEPAQALAVAA